MYVTDELRSQYEKENYAVLEEIVRVTLGTIDYISAKNKDKEMFKNIETKQGLKADINLLHEVVNAVVSKQIRKKFHI